MTNPNDPAFARPLSQLGPEETAPEQEGLTKREYFAGLAMQGILAQPKLMANVSPEEIAKWAVIDADAIIAELSK